MSSIDIFPWNQCFNTGREDIDQSHRQLARQLNRLAHQLVFGSDDLPPLQRLFDTLTTEVIQHIQSDKMLVSHGNVPEAIQRLQTARNHRPLSDLAAESLTVLSHWLLTHLLETRTQAVTNGPPIANDILLSVYASLSNNTLKVIHEIAAYRQAETRLVSSEQRFSDIAHVSADWIWEVDAQGYYTYASDSVFTLLGYHPDELLGKRPFDFMAPDEALRVAEAFNDILTRQTSFQNLENVVLGKDGAAHVILTNGTPIIDIDGILQGYRGVDRDITEQRRAETALIESKNLLQAIIDTAPVRVFWKDRDSRYLGCNPAFAKDAGKACPEALIGQDDYQMSWSVHADLYRADDRNVIETGNARLAYEEPLIIPDGRTIHLRTSKVPLRNQDDEIIGVLGVYDDISELKIAEAELNLTTQRLKEAQRIAHIGNWELDLVQNRLIWSDEIFHIFEIDPQCFDANYEAFLQAIHPDDREAVNAAYQHSLESRQSYEITHRLLFADGRIKFVQERCQTYFSEDGQALRSVGTMQDITERKQAEEAKVALDRFFQQSMNLHIIIDYDGTILKVNDTWTQVLGYQPSDMEGHVFFEFLHPDDIEITQQETRKLSEGQTTFYFENRYRHRHGGYRLLTWSAASDNDQRVIYGAAHDITEYKKAEQALRESELHFRTVANGVNALIWTAGNDRQCNYFNDPWLAFTGRFLSQELGDGWLAGLHPDDVPHYHDTYRQHFERRLPFSVEYRLRRADGEYRWIQDNANPRFDSEGRFIGYIGFCYDITEEKEHQWQLEYIAHYDALTGLPNRMLLADRLHQAVAQTKRHDRQLAVVYIDLDGFKQVNDTHGHQAGDQLLKVLASRMKQCLREGDTIARLGGDEFVAVLVDLPDIETSESLLMRLLSVASQPVDYQGYLLQVSSSIGVTYRSPFEDSDADQLLRQADQAMYQAKLTGKNRFHVFDTEQDRNLRGHHASLERIRQALSNNEFVLHYQPKVNLRTGSLIGAEALIRWQHPQQGLLPPAQFLPELENHPLAIQLDEWVLKTALAQIANWQRQDLRLPVSVNISARNLLQLDFVERVAALLANEPTLDSGCLELEVLETSALEDIDHVSRVITDCAKMGVDFALDDFGIGYSSLLYLKRLPAAVLKIDQSFVRDMLTDPDDLTIIDGVLGLATAFGRKVVAEGVETVEHGEALLRLGCELAQGYGIARAMPAEAIPLWREQWQPDPRWAQMVHLASSQNRLPC